MSNEFKLVPGIWHPISAINDTNRYEPSFLLHCPDLICSDFNPSGVVEGHWCDDEGWQAAVWCGYHDEFHTKFVTPTLIMTIPSIAAPQPPALGGVPAGIDLQRIVTEALMGMIAAVTSTSPPTNEPPPPFIQSGIDRAVSRISAHLAPLQAEIEHLRAEGALIVQHMNDYKKERDHLKARCDELHRMLGLAWGSGDVSAEDCRKIDAALSKPAEIDPVEYGPTPGCKQCEEAESCGFTDCPECGAQLCEDVNGDGFRVDTTLSKPAGSEQV
ncbi:hypothetical protein [Pseudomonas syringae]|uniref:hypothetical protein n=1 Tax=Pseudomonas syringae TaxID=317 RepID=UPI001F3063A6|nr:hypothetical protein [Pseudomonas syringae]